MRFFVQRSGLVLLVERVRSECIPLLVDMQPGGECQQVVDRIGGGLRQRLAEPLAGRQGALISKLERQYFGSRDPAFPAVPLPNAKTGSGRFRER